MVESSLIFSRHWVTRRLSAAIQFAIPVLWT